MKSERFALAPTESTTTSTFRLDIQLLRGLAITLVVLYHASERIVPGGYLGVDIFFVVSGFVIAKLIKDALDDGTFRFSDFYFRRAKRLLPAAYTVFLATVALAPFFLVYEDFADFVKSLMGALTFTGNIVLWMQTGYFAPTADLKPLLHVWTLSLEEQYYLILPAALVFVPRRYWAAAIIAALATSLALCLVVGPIKPGANFYLLPTRAWELLLGTLGSVVLIGQAPQRMAFALFWPALAVLLLVPFFPMGGVDPGMNGLAACFATLVVLLRHAEPPESSHLVAPLRWMGDRSYSIYLVHWPLFSFASNAYLSNVPASVRLVLIVASLVAGHWLYRHIEKPLRHARMRLAPASVLTATVASAALLGAGFAVEAGASRPSEAVIQAAVPNYGFGAACNFYDKFSPTPECSNTPTPRLLLWGDSYAMHLLPGILATTGEGVVQATQSRCGPFADLAPIVVGDTYYQREWAERCHGFNASVLDYLAVTPSIEVVVLSSEFDLYVNPPDAVLLSGNGPQYTQVVPAVATAVRSMRTTAARIRGLGKRVVIVAPPPGSQFNAGLCLRRKATARLVLSSDTCVVPNEDYRHDRANILEFLRRASTDASVPLVSFDDVLCDADGCHPKVGETYVYRDTGHLTRAGSVLLGQRKNLGPRLMAVAR